MYLVYKNNIQMYLVKENIVIKTWNRFFTLKEDKDTFEMIKKVIDAVRSPVKYEKILSKLGNEKKKIDKAISILLKTNVIMAAEDPSLFDNKYLYTYDNPLSIIEKMNSKKVNTSGIPDRIVRLMQTEGMKISDEKGVFSLVWNKGSLDELDEKLFGQDYEKTIVCGEEKGIYYLIIGDVNTNDIRKVRYYVKNTQKTGSANDNQRIIFEEILVNACIKSFYADQDADFIIVNPDLSVNREKLNMHISCSDKKAALISEDTLAIEAKEVLYPDFDEFVNNLPFVGYFGSLKQNQLPIPKQELWLIDKNGDVSEKILSAANNCETAMLMSFRKALKIFLGEDFQIYDDKQIYYFNLLADKLFAIDIRKYYRKFELIERDIDISCYKHGTLNVYKVFVDDKKNRISLNILNTGDMNKEICYALMELGLTVNHAMDLSEKAVGAVKDAQSPEDIETFNRKLLNYLTDNGSELYEESNEYSEKLKGMGIYLGRLKTERIVPDV